jgi:hypothetical protein
MLQLGFSALHWCAHYGHAALGKTLLDYGADASARDDIQVRALVNQQVLAVTGLCCRSCGCGSCHAEW